MKKSMLALAVAGVCFTSTAFADTVIYDKDDTSFSVTGRVQSVLYSGHNGKAGNNDSSIVNSARFGVAGRTKLTDGIYGYAATEWEMANSDEQDQHNEVSSRDQYVGVDFSDFGRVQGGKMTTPLYYVAETTDILEDYGCVGAVVDDTRHSGQFQYMWQGYGVDVIAGVQTASNEYSLKSFSSDIDGDSVEVNKGGALSVGYTSPAVLFGPIGNRAGYEYNKFDVSSSALEKNESATKDLDKTKAWAVALFWGDSGEGFYVAANYSSRKHEFVTDTKDYKVNGVEAVVAYNFENGLGLAASYQWQKYDPDNGDSYEAKVVPLIASFDFNENFKVWAEARIDADSDNEFADHIDVNAHENVYSIGARYTF